MASDKNALAMCDICGWVYPHRLMKENSYGLIICPEDFEGNFDLKNHPQNKIPDVRDNPSIRNPRPDIGGRNLMWDQTATSWDSTDEYWQLI